MATIDFNDCGTYMEGGGGGCDPAQWSGTAFIDSGSSNAYGIKFITDANRDAAYPPYTLTSLHVSVDNFGEDAFKRIDLKLFSPTETILGSNDTHNHTFLFDPPIESSRLSSILVWTDYYPTQVLFINATGAFPGVGPEPTTRCVLYKHTGITETVETVDVPASSGGSHGTSGTQYNGHLTISRALKPWPVPTSFGSRGVKRPIKIATPGSGGGSGDVTNPVIPLDGKKLINSVGEDGSSGATIVTTDSKGNTTSAGPHIPNDSL